MTVPAHATVPILPGPNPTPGTVSTALAVLSAAAENIARIDVDAIAELITEFGTPVPDRTAALVEAAAVFRASCLGTVPLPSAQLDRIHAWLLVHAPDQLDRGVPVAEVVIGLLRRALDAPAAPRDRAVVVAPAPLSVLSVVKPTPGPRLLALPAGTR